MSTPQQSIAQRRIDGFIKALTSQRDFNATEAARLSTELGLQTEVLQEQNAAYEALRTEAVRLAEEVASAQSLISSLQNEVTELRASKDIDPLAEDDEEAPLARKTPKLPPKK